MCVYMCALQHTRRISEAHKSALNAKFIISDSSYSTGSIRACRSKQAKRDYSRAMPKLCLQSGFLSGSSNTSQFCLLHNRFQPMVKLTRTVTLRAGVAQPILGAIKQVGNRVRDCGKQGFVLFELNQE